MLPDEVTPGDTAGVSGSDWWLGMPPETPGEFALDARLTRFVDGTVTSFDTIDVCRGACRHIGYGGNGLLVMDNAVDGIQLVDAGADAGGGGGGGVVETLPSPLPSDDAPILLAGRGDVLIAASGVSVFRRNGAAWDALPDLDFPAFSVDVEPGDVVVATRDVDGELLPAVLVGDAWVNHDDELAQGDFVAFLSDGSIATQDAPAGFVPLRMFTSGLLCARLEGTTLDAVVVGAAGDVTTWASLGSQDAINPASFRATVFEDGTVGVLYPGAPRSEGVGPKTVLHVGPSP